ncbi:unnamed protein product [Ixodes persulcatus]
MKAQHNRLVVRKHDVQMKPWPGYIEERIRLWDELKAKHDRELAARVSEPIKVTLPDGRVLDAQSWKTTPYTLAAEGISKGLADSVVIAKVDGVLWDLDRPLEADCSLQLLKFDDPEGQQVFWHSSAHIMGEALERIYGGCLCYGPPIEGGFYYDMHLDGGQGVSAVDHPSIEQLMRSIVKEKQPFERLELPKEELLRMFQVRTPASVPGPSQCLDGRMNERKLTLYAGQTAPSFRRGPNGSDSPSVPLAGARRRGSHWPLRHGLRDAEARARVSTQQTTKGVVERLACFAFTSHKKCLGVPRAFFAVPVTFVLTGVDCSLKIASFFSSAEYNKRGFQEVVTPNMYNSKLWLTSGHWQHYQDNMFSFDVEKETFALKPMNCPGHCLMFDVRPRSWRELPLRMADFGVLHRNELSGALTGLTRVRRFQQDDAHIFCASEQIASEMKGALEFLKHIYSIFGFTFKLKLSTRPEGFLGDIEVWNDAEKQLEQSLNDFGYPWTLNPGDGAFYGPKIDITIMDALRRQHQCATIQLDFQLPIRFNLSYISETGEKKRPVIIHRAILGSVERMIAILTENYGGKWPFWLSPRQATMVPVGPMYDDYALEVKRQLCAAGFRCDADLDPGNTMNKKIRNAQLDQYNFILVVGEREKTSGTVNVRTRDNKVHGEFSVADVIERFSRLKREFVPDSEESF